MVQSCRQTILQEPSSVAFMAKKSYPNCYGLVGRADTFNAIPIHLVGLKRRVEINGCGKGRDGK